IGWRYRRGRKKTGTNCFCWAQFEGPVGRTIPAHTHRDIHTHKCPCTHVQAQHTPHTFTYICKYPYATHTHTLTISPSLSHIHKHKNTYIQNGHRQSLSFSLHTHTHTHEVSLFVSFFPLRRHCRHES